MFDPAFGCSLTVAFLTHSPQGDGNAILLASSLRLINLILTHLPRDECCSSDSLIRYDGKESSILTIALCRPLPTYR